MTLEEVLAGVAEGSMDAAEAEQVLRTWGFVEIGHHRIDLQREQRTAIPEVVLGLGKSAEQLREIAAWFSRQQLPLLVTKVDEAKAAAIRHVAAGAEYHRLGGLMRMGRSHLPTPGSVAVVTGGSSDVPVAEEAAGTLEFFGIEVKRAYDCGVAGLHRLLAEVESLREADVLIVVAGMEGALPSVVGGLFRQPLIAVPTSVGYGANFEGLAPLLAMLNSCAPGISVVNIDNGFGAAASARTMLEMARRKSERKA